MFLRRRRRSLFERRYGTSFTVASIGRLRVETITLLTHVLRVPKLFISLGSEENSPHDKVGDSVSRSETEMLLRRRRSLFEMR